MLAPDFSPLLGDPRILGEGNLVKGNLISSYARYIGQNYGERAVTDLARTLSPRAARYLSDPPLPLTWNEMGPLIEIDGALVNGLFGGKIDKLRKFAADIARHDLTTLYKTLSGSPSLLFKRIGLAYRMYFKYGDMSVTVASEASGTVTLSGGGLPLYMCSQGLSGWIEAGLEISGSRRIVVEHTACRHRGAPCCTWTACWA